MIISHKYKFIFIKTKKTAGTSIEVYLSKLCGPDAIVTPIYPAIEGHVPRNYKGYFNPLPDFLHYGFGRWLRIAEELIHRQRFYHHIPASLVQNRIPDGIWNSYYKFCVERDPFDKTLSHYYMLKTRSGGKLTLEEYFKRGRFCLNKPQYTNSRGDVIVDHILRYEDLNAELGCVFSKLGIPYSGRLRESAKGEARKDRRSYEEILSSEQIARINEVFADEIRIKENSW
ncbi:Sulfotransferase family protein [Mariprofundus aestuarium]|uniref:Sulfotransferase family protein n=1 Tax=Mariprofundus aestuarium TaxID=1921086 RepID=A0A2K8KXI4_MARES|nr:sulfotransferase family 2 domain-containing protein [Mariprofundus aestuarium]ATX79655.1 Sulfotransferase family protein [Mariprofundus aestuarium]